MKRLMLQMRTPNGSRIVKCTHCSWWSPRTEDLGSVQKAFEEHDCVDHPLQKKPDKPIK